MSEENQINTLTIQIYYSETNEGYMYDIYECEASEVEEIEDSIDGGLCTGTIKDALGMATEMAEEIIKRRNAKK